MKNKFVFFLFVSIVGAATAASPVEAIKNLSNRTDTVIKKGELTSDQRAFLWDKTAQDRAGYLVVEVDKNYLYTIRYFLNDPTLKAEPGENLKKINVGLGAEGFSFLGKLVEDSFRYNAIYRAKNSDLLMITVWAYSKAGAAISTSEEFFNQKISEKDAVLSLAIAKNEKVGIWKLTWTTSGVLYEVYLSDRVDAYGKPNRVPEDIMKIARELDKISPIP